MSRRPQLESLHPNRVVAVAGGGIAALVAGWLWFRGDDDERLLSGLDMLAATRLGAFAVGWPVTNKTLQSLARPVQQPSFHLKVIAARAQVPGASDIPLLFLLSWISHESGGRVATDTERISTLDEHGFFQISRAESKTLGLNAAQHERLKQDEAYSLEQGIRLVMYYRRRADWWLRKTATAWSPARTAADYWAFVKLMHSGGTGGAVCFLRAAAAELDRPPVGFGELHATAAELLEQGRLPALVGRDNCGLPGTARGKPLARLVLNNAAQVGSVLVGMAPGTV